MISILKAPAEKEGAQLLRDLFSKRYELFVEGRGWRTLDRPDHLDIDKYDDDQTTYIIKLMNGDIVGGARLRPTLIPHMLADVFGDLCEGGAPPTGATIHECSRTFVARRHPERRAIFAEVLLAAAQYSLANGVDQLTGVLETWWLNSYLALGLNATPLGMPRDVEGMMLLAVSFNVDRSVCDNLSARVASIKNKQLNGSAKPQTTMHAA